MSAVIVRLAAGTGALLALGACGSSPSADGHASAAAGADGASQPASTSVTVVAGEGPTSVATTAATTVTVVSTSASTIVATSTPGPSDAGDRRATADLRVDGATISVADDGNGALLVRSLDTEEGWEAAVDDRDPARLRVELTAPGRRVVVDIRLTDGGIVTSTDSRSTSTGSALP